MKQAVWIAAVDHVRALRRAPIALKLLVSVRREAKADWIRFEHTLRAIEDQKSFRLVKAHARYFWSVLGTEFIRASRKKGRHTAQQEPSSWKFL